MKIVILDGYTENPGDLSWDAWEKLGEVSVYDRTPRELTAERIGDAEIVITNKTVIGADILDACGGVKYIGVLATGYNVVDVSAAKSRGITVTNIPTYGTAAVAQFVFALLLELCHHAGEHNNSVQRGDWSRCEDFCYWNYPLVELAGKTMGIIGFGRIGQAVAKIAAGFGMKVIYYDGFVKGEFREASPVSLNELLGGADVISLNCPLTESTNGIINKENIALMKDGVMLVNTSRGPLINEGDLAAALKSGKVAAAAVDVVSEEPISRENKLLGLPNCIITPHIAWAPKESRMRLMDIAVGNLQKFLGGEPCNVVN